jgi:hypothetical protein
MYLPIKPRRDPVAARSFLSSSSPPRAPRRSNPPPTPPRRPLRRHLTDAGAGDAPVRRGRGGPRCSPARRLRADRGVLPPRRRPEWFRQGWLGWVPARVSPLVHQLGMGVFVFRAGSRQRGWDQQIQLDNPRFICSFPDSFWCDLGLGSNGWTSVRAFFSTFHVWCTVVITALIWSMLLDSDVIRSCGLRREINAYN